MEQLKDAFWEAVVDCLEHFHGLSRVDAQARASDLRTRLERLLGDRFEPGIVYHDEPFYIAARLAGRELDLLRHQAEYDEIRARRLGGMAGLELAQPASASRPGQEVW